MKKILLTMIGMCLILGMQAQTTKRLREYRNPQIEGLMKYAKSMGVDVWEFYSRNYRSMSFHVSEYNDSDPHDNPALLIDSIKSTFLGLADEAADKYLWEKDKEGRDSIYYTLTLGKYSNAGKIRESEMGKQTEFRFPAPEILTFKYIPYKRENIKEGEHVSIGSADLHYQFYPDSIDRKIEQVEMDELMEAIGKVFKKEKVKYHTTTHCKWRWTAHTIGATGMKSWSMEERRKGKPAKPPSEFMMHNLRTRPKNSWRKSFRQYGNSSTNTPTATTTSTCRKRSIDVGLHPSEWKTCTRTSGSSSASESLMLKTWMLIVSSSSPQREASPSPPAGKT